MNHDAVAVVHDYFLFVGVFEHAEGFLIVFLVPRDLVTRSRSFGMCILKIKKHEVRAIKKFVCFMNYDLCELV